MRGTAWTRSLVTAAAALLIVASSATATPATIPMNVHVTATTATSFSLAWDPPTEAGVVGAHIAASSASLPYFPDLRSTDATTTGGDIGGLTCGASYDISVNWSDGTSYGPQSAISATTAPCTEPTAPAPSGLAGSALSAGSIHFSWDDAPAPAAGDVAYSLTGPLSTPRHLTRTSHRTSIDLSRLVCGETYTFKVGWVNDEGAVSPTSSVSANTSDCSTLGPPRPGPAMVKVTQASLSAYTVEFDPKRDDAIGYRLSATGPDVAASSYENTFLASGDTFRAIRFHATCGETYTVGVQWVFNDGGLSQATSASAPAPACVAAPEPGPGVPGLPETPDTTPPVVSVRQTHLRLNKKGAVAIPLLCAGDNHCIGRLTLRPGANPRRVRLPKICGKGSFRIPRDVTRSISVVLSRSALAALRKAHSAHLVIAVLAADDSGNKAASSVRVTVSVPAPTKRR